MNKAVKGLKGFPAVWKRMGSGYRRKMPEKDLDIFAKFVGVCDANGDLVNEYEIHIWPISRSSPRLYITRLGSRSNYHICLLPDEEPTGVAVPARMTARQVKDYIHIHLEEITQAMRHALDSNAHVIVS